MLWNLGSGWLLMAVVVVGMLSFMVAMMLNAIMGRDGFGPTGNAAIIAGGFFFAILAVNMLGYKLADLKLAAMTGLAGAFACLAALAAIKAVLSRR